MSHHRRGLRPAVCYLLAGGPKSGAEIMDEIEKMSHGWWRPSPGSVYPLLEEMARDGVLKRKDDGRYELSPSARTPFGWAFGRPGPRTAEDAVRELSGLVAYLEDLRSSRASELDGARPALKEAAERLAHLLG